MIALFNLNIEVGSPETPMQHDSQGNIISLTYEGCRIDITALSPNQSFIPRSLSTNWVRIIEGKQLLCKIDEKVDGEIVLVHAETTDGNKWFLHHLISPPAKLKPSAKSATSS